MPGNYFKSGSWNICCDVCNRKVKATDIFKRWDGLLVCKDDFEQDHPQKYIRVQADGMAVPEIRERGGEINVGPACNVITSSAFADYATADCSRADKVVPSFSIIAQLAAGIPTGTF